jgi:hypothetical protein
VYVIITSPNKKGVRMIGSRKPTWVLGALVVVSLMAASAPAGLLGTGLSYNDGTQWEGTKSFSGTVTGGTLSGSLDYAVFTAGNFNSLFSGYTPTPGELIYGYQVHNTGTVDIRLSKLLLIGGAPADAAGTFTWEGLSGQAPYDSYVIPGANVTWDFTNGHDIVPAGQSIGLAFCSIRRPTGRDVDVIVDGGGSVNVANVAGPGATPIPEPTTLALLAAAVSAGFLVMHSRRKEK